MDHHAAASNRWTPSPPEHFTGDVWFGPLSDQGPLNVLAVQFAPGSRTDWHSHPEGQVLYVVSGAGLVQSADGHRVEIAPGDVVHAPPGEVHWHGAKPDAPMLHLSLTTGGDTVWEPRKVTDAEYAGD